MNNSDDPDKYLDKATSNADTEDDETDQTKYRSGKMHTGYRDVGWEDKKSTNSTIHNKSRKQKNRSKNQDKEVRNWLLNKYKAHCQICLAGKKENELVPNETYGVDPEHRVKIVEAAHANLSKEGGSDDLDNRLLLCLYHHQGMGDKYRQEILSALKNEGVKNSPFNNSNDKGYTIQTKILGHQSIGSLKREKGNIKIFFTEEHKNYWLKKSI